MLQFRGSVVTSDAGLLAYRELDNALDLTATAEGLLADSCTGKNGRHALVGLLRQSIFGRLAGYEDVNDAQRLRHDPAICWIVGGKQQKAVQRHRVRWGDSKRAGSRNRRIYHPLWISPANGSIALANIETTTASCSIWIRA
jgi:hypothetical protein